MSANNKNGSSQRGRKEQSDKKQRIKATPARLLALDVLVQTRVRSAYVREILNAKRENTELEQREFDFAQVLCFGVISTLGTLDECINMNTDPQKKIQAKVRDCLRISAFELLFLKHEPYVVVSQGVELVKSINYRAAGFANAILHKIKDCAQGFFAGNSLEALARRGGMPIWLTKRFVQLYGFERTEKLFQDSLLPAPTYFIDAPKAKFTSDLAAQFVASLVPLQGLEGLEGRILEIGAGRGTKTALLQLRALEELGHGANIYSLDVHAFKADVLQERLKELGLPQVKTITADARNVHELCQNKQLPKHFETVFIDAPCSGTGTFRRHPEGRWRLEPKDIESLTQLQFEILCSASKCVEKDGVLIYSTCSILPEENEEVIKRFLTTKDGVNFEFKPLEENFAEQNWHCVDGIMFQSIPAKNMSDGHFAAVLKRVS